MVFEALGFIVGSLIAYVVLKFIIFPFVDKLILRYKKDKNTKPLHKRNI